MPITLIGTSHIARKSLHEIKQAFETQQPDIIAVELDPARMQGLLSNRKETLHPSLIRQIGLAGYLFALIGRALQKKLGDIVRMTPGSDMKYAIRLCHQHQKKLALIDRDILITLQRFSRAFTAKQKWRLFTDILTAPFSKRIRINLNEIPEEEIIETLLLELKKRYPGIYSTLIHERNIYMVKQLLHIHNQSPDAKILAVVGAGHKKEMERLLTAYRTQPTSADS